MTAMADNYQLTLVVIDGDKPVTELSVVAVTPTFKVDSVEPAITFAGTITPEDAGTVLVAYVVGGSSHSTSRKALRQARFNTGHWALRRRRDFGWAKRCRS